MVDDQILECHFFSFPEKTVQHDTHSKEYILHDVGIDLLLLRLGGHDGIESGIVLSDQFPLKNPCDFSGAFDFGDLVLVHLSSDCLEELFLLPTLILHLLFDDIGKFLAVLGV